MKKKFLLIIISILFIGISGCFKHNSYFKIENADSVTIFHGASSYVFVSTDKEIIKLISKNLNDLSFKKTNAQMNAFSMFTINISNDKGSLAQLSVDEKGVFYIDDTADCYKVNSGEFDYDYIQDIYMKGEQKELKK
jgi:hypothetical protein